jgi:hypothetical protein
MLSYVVTLIMGFVPQTAQSLPEAQAKCSETRVRAEAPELASVPPVVTDLTVEIPQPAYPGEQCKVTFATEALADGAFTSLFVTYAFSFPGQAPSDCKALPGPVGTRIDAGATETRTFISVFENSVSPHGTMTLTPCINAGFGAAVVLGRHCVVVECRTK